MKLASEEVVNQIKRDWEEPDLEIDDDALEIYIALAVETARGNWERAEGVEGALRAMDEGFASVPLGSWPALEIEIAHREGGAVQHVPTA
jgi:hypothetical protein